MDMWWLLAAVSGYLIGSISFSRVISIFKSGSIPLEEVAVTDADTGEVYKRRPSAISVSMAHGWQSGCLASVLDMLKVALPALALRLLFPGQPYFLILAAFAVAGHNWPVYYRFKGGAGISAIYGGLLVIDPLAIVVPALAGLLIGIVILRSYLVMFLLSLLLVIPWLWYRFPDSPYWIFAVAVNVLYLITMAIDTRQWLRPGVKIMKERDIMDQMPMGRAMNKMMDRLRFTRSR